MSLLKKMSKNLNKKKAILILLSFFCCFYLNSQYLKYGGKYVVYNDQYVTGYNTYEYEYESLLLFDRWDEEFTVLTDNKKQDIDSLIKKLKQYNLWANADAIYVENVTDSVNAKLCWNNSSYNLTLIGTMRFLAKNGYYASSAASNAYCNTNFNGSTDGVNYTQNNSSISWYSYTNSTEDGKYEWGTDNSTGGHHYAFTALSALAGNDDYWAMQMSTLYVLSAITNTNDLFVSTRNSSTEVKLYQGNGNVKGSSTESTSVALANSDIFTHNINLDGSPQNNHSSVKKIGFFRIGASMSYTDVTNLYSIITWWNEKVVDW